MESREEGSIISESQPPLSSVQDFPSQRNLGVKNSAGAETNSIVEIAHCKPNKMKTRSWYLLKPPTSATA